MPCGDASDLPAPIQPIEGLFEFDAADNPQILINQLNSVRFIKLKLMNLNELQPKQTIELYKAWKKQTFIKELDLSDNELNDESIKYLCSALAENTTLKTLNLAGNNLSPEATLTLANHLPTNLTHLDLAENNLGWEGISRLLEILKTHATLEIINLQSNHLEPEEHEKLASLLKENNFTHKVLLDPPASQIVSTTTCIFRKMQIQ